MTPDIAAALFIICAVLCLAALVNYEIRINK
jgi:hypothetical protein